MVDSYVQLTIVQLYNMASATSSSGFFLQKKKGAEIAASAKISILLLAHILNYNPPNNFCGLSLNETDHVVQIGRWLSDDIRRPICYPSSDFISTEERPRNRPSVQAKF